MQNVVCEHCSLLTKAPCAFSHIGQTCGWSDLVATCPDCKREGDGCSFFSENEAEGACTGFSRLVTLAIRSQFDGGVRRLEPQLRKRIAILSGGETSQAAVSFAAGHVKTYKDGLKITDGIWLPQDLSTKDTVFYWNRTVLPWQFSLQQSTSAEAVTMSGLLGALGIVPGVNLPSSAPASVSNDMTASLVVQVAQLKQMMEAMVRAGDSVQDVNEASRAAAAAMQGARSGGADNPSQIFNLGSNNNNVTGIGNLNPLSGQQLAPSADAELVKALAAAGVAPAQILHFLQTRASPPAPVMEHRNAWFQVAEGTSPLCVYTGMQGETRQAATPKTLHVQTFEASSSNKLSLKLMVWPAAKPESVAVHQFRNLGEDWKRTLAELNVRLVQITPAADRGLVPAIPLNVDGFLEHCYTSLRAYDPAVILRAWEAAHQFMIDEYITKRSKPSWDTVWMMPIFQVELSSSTRAACATGASLSDASQFCANWNFQLGTKCKLEPSADCRKVHKCVRCGGPHPVTKCGSRD